jgi:hypothetical protein
MPREPPVMSAVRPARERVTPEVAKDGACMDSFCTLRTLPYIRWVTFQEIPGGTNGKRSGNEGKTVET